MIGADRRFGPASKRVLERRMPADFLIGAHAAVAGFGLVSRDRGYARSFKLDLLDPAREKG